MSEEVIRLAARWVRGDFTLDVNLSVRSRVLGIIGPSGSGKSTLIGIAAGLLRPPQCELTFRGHAWVSTERNMLLGASRRGVGLVPQDGLLFPHLDVRANLSAARHAATGCTPADVEQLAARLGIAEMLDRAVGSLSGGQRQRVALGRALLSQPRWLLLDEPLGALDYARRRALLPLLRSIVDSSQVPLWFVSHDAAEVMALCDEIILVEHGRVMAQGRTEALRDAILLGYAQQGRHENLFRGAVESLDGDLATVAIGPNTHLIARSTQARVGERVFVSLHADDIMVSTERPLAISARNVLLARVHALPTSAFPFLEAELPGGPTLLVELTRATVTELGLDSLSNVYVLFKASSCRVWANST